MPVITNVVEIIVQGTVVETTGGAKNIFNVFHYFQNPTVPGPQTAIAVANQFLASIFAGIAARLSAGYVPNQTLCRYLDLTTNPLLTANPPQAGAIILPRLAATQAVVTPLRSASRGKNFRGTKHFGPIPAASVVSDELVAAEVTAWQALLPGFAAAITVGGQTYSPCIVSRSLSQLRLDPVVIQGAIVIQALLNKTIGTMRRRKEKTAR
jgi:hypothetical protein